MKAGKGVKRIERLKEIAKTISRRETLTEDPFVSTFKERSLKSILDWLFKPDAFPHDPATFQKKKKGVIRKIFEKESLPRLELPKDQFIPTPGEESPGSLFSMLFKPDALPQDPSALIQEKKKGVFRAIFERESLPREEISPDPSSAKGEGERVGSFLGWLFESEVLPKDPSLSKKEKGFFRTLFGGESLSEDL